MENQTTASTELQKKSERTRQKIMNAYIRLMHEKDFLTIKVKTIVEEAQITRGTFYLYFSDTSDLITQIENQLLSGMPQMPPKTGTPIDLYLPPTFEVINNTSWEREWFRYYQANHQAFNALLGPHGDRAFYRQIVRYLQDSISVNMKRDLMPEDDYQTYFLNLLPDIFLMISKEWTGDAIYQDIDLDSIVSIISTIRAGSMYKRHLELHHNLR